MADEVVAPQLARVKPVEIAERIKKNDIVIVDVRDEKEVAHGRIKGSLNVPSSVFKSEDSSALDEVIKSQLIGNKEVVVHCHFSKVRGPTCAMALSNRLKALGVEAAIEVKVLEGGVAAFMDEFKDDASLVDLPDGGWVLEQTH